MNESDESPLLAHIAQRSLPIKDAQNNRLPKDKTSTKLNDEVDINGINIDVAIHYTVTPEILPKHGEHLLIEGPIEDYQLIT